MGAYGEHGLGLGSCWLLAAGCWPLAARCWPLASLLADAVRIAVRVSWNLWMLLDENINNSMNDALRTGKGGKGERGKKGRKTRIPIRTRLIRECNPAVLWDFGISILFFVFCFGLVSSVSWVSGSVVGEWVGCWV